MRHWRPPFFKKLYVQRTAPKIVFEMLEMLYKIGRKSNTATFDSRKNNIPMEFPSITWLCLQLLGRTLASYSSYCSWQELVSVLYDLQYIFDEVVQV